MSCSTTSIGCRPAAIGRPRLPLMSGSGASMRRSLAPIRRWMSTGRRWRFRWIGTAPAIASVVSHNQGNRCGMNAAHLFDRLPGETWKIALNALAQHKLRAALSMIGVVIGSASLVLVVTAGLTGGRYILEQIEGVGSNLAYAELRRSGGQAGSLSDEITTADLDAIETQVPGVAAVAGSRDLPMTVVVNGVERPVTLIG